MQVLEDHSRPVLSLAIADNKLFSGSYDYTIKVWSLDTLQRLKTLTGEHVSGSRMNFQHNLLLAIVYMPEQMFMDSAPSLARLLRALRGRKLMEAAKWPHAGHSDAVRALAVANERLFSGSYDGTVKVWDVRTMECLQTLAGHTGPVRTLVYSGGHMFSGSYDKTVNDHKLPVGSQHGVVDTLECMHALPVCWII